MDGAGRVARPILTPGQAGDAPRAPALPAGPRRVVADAAYDGDAIRALIRRPRACIKPDPTRRRETRCDRERYKQRDVIERFFGSTKRGFRRAATRYEKKAENYLGFAWLASIGQMSTRLEQGHLDRSIDSNPAVQGWIVRHLKAARCHSRDV